MGEYEGENRRSSEEWGRRDHDNACTQNQANMKEWVKDKLCLMKKDILGSTAPTKARLAIVLSIMMLMLAASFTSAYKSISAAENATEIHARNTGAIKYNKQEIEEVKKDHSVLVDKVETMEERQIIMYGDIKTILGIIRKELEE